MFKNMIDVSFTCVILDEIKIELLLLLLLLVVACCFLLLLVVACCCLLLLVVACCCLVLLVVACCCLLLLVVACCCLLLLVVVVVVVGFEARVISSVEQLRTLRSTVHIIRSKYMIETPNEYELCSNYTSWCWMFNPSEIHSQICQIVRSFPQKKLNNPNEK